MNKKMIGLKEENFDYDDCDTDVNTCVYKACVGYKSDSDDDELVDIESQIRQRRYKRLSDKSAYCTILLYTFSIGVIGTLYWHSVILYR